MDLAVALLDAVSVGKLVEEDPVQVEVDRVGFEQDLDDLPEHLGDRPLGERGQLGREHGDRLLACAAMRVGDDPRAGYISSITTAGRSDMRTIDEWLEAYGDSHRHPVNETIHRIAVPIIVLDMLGFLHAVPTARLAAWLPPL